MNMRTIVVAAIAVLVATSTAVAQETDTAAGQGPVPARFVGGLDAASEKIRFPDHKRDVTVYINCAARVSAAGEVERFYCLDYYGGADTKFRQAAEEFIGKVEVSPARVDGEPRAVEMYFRIFFGRQGELYAAGVFPNWGDDVERHGLEYEAPQRYNEDPPPPKCGTIAGMSRVEVNAEGRAVGEVDLMMSYGKPEHYGTCENWMTGLVRDGRYIPAYHEGKPVAAIYVELRGNPEWFTLKEPEGL
jgi:hypothetical protein